MRSPSGRESAPSSATRHTRRRPSSAAGEILSRDGDTLVVGAPGSGPVFVHARDDAGRWTQRAHFAAVGTGDDFGRAIALDGDGRTLAIGAARGPRGAVVVRGQKNL